MLLRVSMAAVNSVTVTLPLSDLEIVYEGPTAVTLTSLHVAGCAPDAALVWQVTALAALLGITLLLIRRRREWRAVTKIGRIEPGKN